MWRLIKSWRWLDQSSGSQIWLIFFQDLLLDILIFKADRHERYVFLSSPGESDKPDVRNGFVLSLDELWCPFQDKTPSSPWETAKGKRTSSWWALYQLKPELGALWVSKAVYLEIEVGLLFCLWVSKQVFYTHMYPNTGNIYINQRQLSTWRLGNAIMPFPKKSHYFSLLENTICVNTLLRKHSNVYGYRTESNGMHNIANLLCWKVIRALSIGLYSLFKESF